MTPSPDDLGPEPRDIHDLQAAAPPRVVGVVRVLRGRLAAPCRCCTEAADVPNRRDEDDRS